MRVTPIKPDLPAGAAMAHITNSDSAKFVLSDKNKYQSAKFLSNSNEQGIQNAVARNLFEKGYEHQMKQEYSNAINEYDNVISNYPESGYARMSMVQKVYCFEELNQKQSILTYLDGIETNNKDEYLGYHAQSLKVPHLKKQGKYKDAVSICNELSDEENFHNERAKLNLLYQMGYIYKYNLQEKELANAAFTRLIEKYPNDILAVFAKNELDSSKIVISLLKNIAEENIVKPMLPEKFSLSQNYPNPFNAETVIEYDLPQSVHVILEIYNIMGQKVRFMVNEQQPAGQYRIHWDSKDDFGRTVLSGIYILKIKADQYEDTKKMIIIR